MLENEEIYNFLNNAIIIEKKLQSEHLPGRIRAEYKKQFKKCRSDIFNVVKLLDKNLYKIILIKRCINCEKWKTIAEDTGYTVSYLRIMYKKIIEEIKTNQII